MKLLCNSDFSRQMTIVDMSSLMKWKDNLVYMMILEWTGDS
jgi:hypothetical protein